MTPEEAKPKKRRKTEAGRIFGREMGLFSSDHQDREMRASLKRIIEVGIGSRALVGQRMVAARKAWRLSQDVAAGYLGYESGAQLSQVERGTKPIPAHTLCAAARLYHVSGDYLLGLSDSPEVDPRGSRSAEAVRRLHYTLAGMASVFHSAIDRSLGPVEALSVLERLVPAAELASSAIVRFSVLNEKSFSGMPGGSPVVSAVDKLDAVLVEAVAVLKKACAMDAIKLAEIELARQTIAGSVAGGGLQSGDDGDSVADGGQTDNEMGA